MIVKVQLSQFSSDGVHRAFIYNRSRSFQYEGGVNDDLVKVMKGRPKAYFKAKIVATVFEIGDEVEEQDW